MLIINPTKMYIKSAPYLHQKGGNWELDMMLRFFKIMMLNLQKI